MMKVVSIADLIAEKISGEWGTEPTNGFGTNVLRTTNFTNQGSVNFETVVKRVIDLSVVVKKRLRYGDTIIEKSGGSPKQPVGRVVFFNSKSEEPFLCNNFTAILRPKKDVSPNYFFWALYSKHLNNATLRYQNKTTGILNLKLQRYLEEEKVNLPDLETQQKIANILEQADSARQKRRQVNHLTEQFLQSAFLEMFGDLNINKNNYPVKKLSDISNISSGTAKGRRFNGAKTIEVPYMRVANVQDGFLNLKEIKSITIKENELNKYLLKYGDLLLTEGGDPDKLGRGAIWKDQILGCIHQNHIFKVRMDNKLLNPIFLSFQTGSTYGKKYFLKSAKQTTGIASINSTQLKAFPVVLPPLPLQQKFAKLVERVEQLRGKQRQSEKELDNLFNSLMGKYFG